MPEPVGLRPYLKISFNNWRRWMSASAAAVVGLEPTFASWWHLSQPEVLSFGGPIFSILLLSIGQFSAWKEEREKRNQAVAALQNRVAELEAEANKAPEFAGLYNFDATVREKTSDQGFPIKGTEVISVNIEFEATNVGKIKGFLKRPYLKIEDTAGPLVAQIVACRFFQVNPDSLQVVPGEIIRGIAVAGIEHFPFDKICLARVSMGLVDSFDREHPLKLVDGVVLTGRVSQPTPIRGSSLYG